MAIQTREQLKRWFSRGKYPTEEQFAYSFDSFVHKDDKIGTDSLSQEVIDYIGERIDDRVGSYKAVVVTQSTGLTVFEADFSQHELKIILAEPNASTVVSALTIQEPDVPAGFAFVRHLIIKNEGNYTINFPSVILGKEINIEAGQKLDASYLFYRSGGSVTYDLTFNVV